MNDYDTCKVALFFRSEESLIRETVYEELRMIKALDHIKRIITIDVWHIDGMTADDYGTHLICHKEKDKLSTYRKICKKVDVDNNAYRLQDVNYSIDVLVDRLGRELREDGIIPKIIELNTPKKKYKVSFISDDSLINEITVEEGMKITIPSVPEKSGCTLEGWYDVNSDTTLKWNFSEDVIKSDTKLYAKWKKTFLPSQEPLAVEMPMNEFIKKYDNHNFKKSSFAKIRLVGGSGYEKYTTDFYDSTYDMTWSFIRKLLEEKGEAYIEFVNERNKGLKNPVFITVDEYKSRLSRNDIISYRRLDVKGLEGYCMCTQYGQYGWINPVLKKRVQELDMPLSAFMFEYKTVDDKAVMGRKFVYIGLREIDYGLIKENSKVRFFDINGAISRLLWKQIQLWNTKKENVSVIIWGEGCLSENMLCYGLLLNIYSNKQNISYHLIGNTSFSIKHPAIPLMNGDKIITHVEEDSDTWNIVRESDVIIITEDVSAAKLQAIAVNGKNAKIYYYSHMSGDVGELICTRNLAAFGRDEEIFTDENIRQEKLIEEAKQLNSEYAQKYNGEAEWDKLTGFLKWSNISSADFKHVLIDILKNNPEVGIDELAELEHIRWCRFHFLNYWTYGIPDNGSNKDTKKKIHKCLCPYSELSSVDKDKNRATVEEIRKQ